MQPFLQRGNVPVCSAVTKLLKSFHSSMKSTTGKDSLNEIMHVLIKIYEWNQKCKERKKEKTTTCIEIYFKNAPAYN